MLRLAFHKFLKSPSSSSSSSSASSSSSSFPPRSTCSSLSLPPSPCLPHLHPAIPSVLTVPGSSWLLLAVTCSYWLLLDSACRATMKPTYVAFQVDCEIAIQESPLQSHGILNSLRILLLALELLLENHSTSSVPPVRRVRLIQFGSTSSVRQVRFLQFGKVGSSSSTSSVPPVRQVRFL